MKFHPDKCETIHTSKCNKPTKHQIEYHLRDHLLKVTDTTKCLLIASMTINSKLDWKTHIGNTVNKATRTLNLV